MNVLLIPPLVSSIFAITLGLFVCVKHIRSSINSVFALLCFETFHWQICWFISYFLTGASEKDLIIRIAFSSIIFIPFTYYHFAVLFLNLSFEKSYIKFGYAFGLLALILLWTSNMFIEGYREFWWGYYPKVGVLFSIYLMVVFFYITRALFLILMALLKNIINPKN